MEMDLTPKYPVPTKYHRGMIRCATRVAFVFLTKVNQSPHENISHFSLYTILNKKTMENMNLDLIKILIGVGIGIVIVIAIVKAVTPRMGMGGMGMMQGMPMQGNFPNGYYQHQQGSGGLMAIITLAVAFLFLFGVFYVSQKLNEEKDTSWNSYEDDKWQRDSPAAKDNYEYEEEPDLSPPEALPPQEQVPESEYDLNVPEAPEEVFKDYNLKVGTPVNISPSGRQGSVSVNEVVPYEESPAIPGEFYLQKAAAPTEERAQHEMEKWESQFPGKVHLGYNQNLDSYAYKVLIGPFRTKEAAQRAAADRKAYIRDLDEETYMDILY